MWRSPHEIGNDKYRGQHEHDADAACCQTTTDESCNETTVCDESERECDDENGAVILVRERDGLENERQNQQRHSHSKQPTDA